jgi:putative effector of murein hydrolase LrgA (UPF0299 family)
LLASLIVWLFIRDWRMVLISSIAIPTSIITTFTFMRVMDFTLNSMTLLGLTLAVGIVIDDAIIVMENIYRYIDEKGMPPFEASIVATKEIAMAVMATTISLVIIFVPIAFMSGYAKRFMNHFGWTMAISIMVSMLVAFTLTPTLSARLLKRKISRKDSGKSGGHGHHDGWSERLYVKTLEWSMAHRLGHRGNLHCDARLDLHREQVHRSRLDASGRPERTRCLAGVAGRVVYRGNGTGRAGHGQEVKGDPGGSRHCRLEFSGDDPARHHGLPDRFAR